MSVCDPAMHAPDPAPRESRAPLARLASRAEGLAAAANRRGVRGQRRRRQPVAQAGPPRRPAGLPPAPPARRPPPVDSRAAGPATRPPAPWPRSRWLSRTALGPPARGRGDPWGVGSARSPHAWRPVAPTPPLASPAAEASRPPARRGGQHPVAHRDGAGDPNRAAARPQPLRVVDAAGCSPLPRGVRTDAPGGPPPRVRAW